jgi:hypothetical protein
MRRHSSKTMRTQLGWDKNGITLRQPQNPYQGTPLSDTEIDQLRTDVKDLLKNKDCANFVSGVLNQLTSETGRQVYSGNAMDIFNAVEHQGGFARRAGPFSAEGGSTVGNKDAYININFAFTPGPYSSADRGRTILHELFHVASSTNLDYSHYAMARAAYDVAAAQGYKGIGKKPSGRDPDGADRPNSDVFNMLLFKACRVR